MAEPLRPEDENITYRRFSNFSDYNEKKERSQSGKPTVTESYRSKSAERTISGARNASVSYRSKKNATRATGAAIQGTGVAMQAGGAAMDAGGKGLMRAGAALSSTGVGAIVGVPLAAVGGGMQAGGKVTKIAGKQARRQGKRVSQIGRRGKQGSLVFKKARATRVTVTVISVGLGTVYMIQFFLGLAYLVTFGILGALDGLSSTDRDTGNILLDAGNYLIGVGRDIVRAAAVAFGFDVGGLFIIAFALCILWSLITLLTLSAIYAFQGIRPLGGNGAGLKNSMFLVTIIASVLPIINMLPIFIFWALAVWKNPN